MLIWFDAVTSKEPLLFDGIAKELEKEGHEVIFTCRDYDYVVSLFKLLGRDVKTLGKHGGGTLYGKLIAGTKRIELLANYIHSLNKMPDYHISFGCPESTRVGFGLGIPVININDSPHAWAVGKLTLPLSKYLVYSDCIIPEKWIKLGATPEQLKPYKGIDEVAWTLDFQPSETVLEQLGLSKNDHFIVGRPEESNAAYMLNDKLAGRTKLDEILSDIFEYYDGLAIIFPRYESQKKQLLKQFKDNVIIPPKAVDTLSLYYYADICITGGATMAREAAAIGTPGISYFPRKLDVLDYIESIGIPLYNKHTIEDAKKTCKDLLTKRYDKNALREKSQNILRELESPVDAIRKLIA